MNNIIALQLKRQRRKFKQWSLKSGHIILLMMIGFFSIAWFQYNLFVKWDTVYALWQGWIVLGLLLCHAFFGVVSNRLPSHLNEITWIYSVPKSSFKIMVALFLSKVIPRLSVWLASAILVELIMLVNGSWHNVVIKGLICYSIFISFDLLSFSLSTIRGSAVPSFVCVGLLGLALIGFVIVSYFLTFGDYALRFNDAFIKLGELLNGRLHLISLMVLLTVTAVSLVVIHMFSERASFKERLVFEGDFWSQYQDVNALLHMSNRKTISNSWWGGKSLTKTYAFVWFEWLLLRKSYKSLALQAVVTVVLALALINISPRFYYVIFTFVIVSHLFGGFLSGMVRHYHSEDLLTTPGSLLLKVLSIEAVAILPNLSLLIGLHVLAAYTDALPTVSAIICFHILFIMTIGLRILVFLHLMIQGKMSAKLYYKQMIGWSLLASLLFSIIYLFSLTERFQMLTIISVSLGMFLLIITAIFNSNHRLSKIIKE
ncbi:sporulation killing factor system integral membrane protein [Amphibacillus cookii]|uniref:sporulation killing factor system integral membrane protein n=1 Tax=Amphibacillus cookii TaxID=767787 RepID=UPI001958B71F|nr:sporulation killing factor system integral membrane protein [Amphibacillus cookii]MBM7541071.1 sporulation killing factor system integral membrane protein [Amphibacillus cookii]